MIFSEDRNKLRRMYADAWQKRLEGKPLLPLEDQIAAVIELHPEYHEQILDGDLDEDFSPEAGRSNPFLHMGLHLGLREQVATDRPQGIATIFRTLAAKLGDPHDAEHRMIECLAEALWVAQRDSRPPDEAAYLECLRKIR